MSEDTKATKTINIHDHMKDAGTKTVPFKPQYVRGGDLFSCPICGMKVSSHSFVCYRDFEDFCQSHVDGHNRLFPAGIIH